MRSKAIILGNFQPRAQGFSLEGGRGIQKPLGKRLDNFNPNRLVTDFTEILQQRLKTM